jgi:hypothetical protein
MDQPHASVRTFKAIYAAEVTAGVLRDQLAALGAPGNESATPLATTLFAADGALRADVGPADCRPLVSIVKVGANATWSLDHEERSYRALELAATVVDPRDAIEVPDAPTSFGAAVRVIVRLRGGELRLRLLAGESLPSLRVWWQIVFPGMLPRKYHHRLPIEIELRLRGDARPAARLALRSLEQGTMPSSLFRPPGDYALRQREPGVLRGTPALPPQPPPIPGAGRESAVAALLGASSDEVVKLQVRDEVPERIRTAINDFTSRLNGFAGNGLVIDLDSLRADLMTPTATTPAGPAGALAYRVLLRALFWHWGTQLKRIFDTNTLRQPFLDVIDALANGDPGAAFIEPARGTAMDDRDFFRRMRDRVTANGGMSPFLPALELIRAASGPLADQIDALTLQTWDINGPEEIAAEAWFQAEFRYLSLQPGGGVEGEHGRQRGWTENRYISEHLGRLIDLELNVGSIALDINQLPILAPTRLVDETDSRFQLIDALDEMPAPGGRKRAGFTTSMRLSRLAIQGDLTTIPTTNSPLVVALSLLMPHNFFKLWNYVNATIELRGVTADILVYFEQDRLSPAGPRLRLWVGGVRAEALDVSGFALSPDPFLDVLFNIMLNEFADHLTPALLQRVRDATLETLQTAANAFGRVLFLEPGPPPPRVDIATDIQGAIARGTTLRENIRLQHLLNLNSEDVFERLARDIDDATRARDEAAALRDSLWAAHVAAANDARVLVDAAGFNPAAMTPPIEDRFGIELTPEEIALLQSTFDAWAAQVPVAAALEAPVPAAEARWQAFLDGWPEGQTACEAVPERFGYRIGLALCRFGAGTNGRALIYPSAPRATQRGDLTLLISTRAFRDMTSGTYFTYRGDPRDTNGEPAVLEQLPTIDWWRDAPEPHRLQPRPNDLRDSAPQLPPGPSPGTIPDWRAYWAVLEAGGRGANFIPVADPAPGEPVAEILVAVNVRVIVTTYTAVMMERCGPDLTRIAAEPEGPAGRLGRFRPPAGPNGPRPDQPSDRPLLVDAEIGFRRVEAGGGPAVLTARALEDTRLRYGRGGEDDVNIDPTRLLFSRLGGGGLSPTDAHCRVITAWDVKSREDWLSARVELRFPVFLGFANFSPREPVRLPGARRLGARADFPILTYRFASDPMSTETVEFTAGGPLAGLGEGENRPWLERLLANHALALVRNSTDRHRRRSDDLYFAYGYGTESLVLQPENFRPYLILGMHPGHWSGVAPANVSDQAPPFLAFNTFGAAGQALNLAIDLFLTDSLLDKLRM